MLARHHFMNSSCAEVAAGLAGATGVAGFLAGVAAKPVMEVLGLKVVAGAVGVVTPGTGVVVLDLPPGPTVVHALFCGAAAAALDARSA
jgi:hypothetical protein